MNRLDCRTRELILHSLNECMSQRACERIHKVSNKTVAKLARDAGDMAIKHIAQLGGLRVYRIQADEIWSFVRAKQKNVPTLRLPQIGDGTVWAYLAICADTKFILTYELGDRRIPDAKSFMRSVRAKLAEDEHGNLLVRPKIITDGLKAYEEAGEVAFGTEADRAMLIKQYTNTDPSGEPTPASRYEGALKVQLNGAVPDRDLHTSYVERANLSLRMGNKRYTRKTNAFSKTLRNHERQLAIWIMYYNYCLLPSPQRRTCPDTGEVRWEKRLTPAMELGLTDRVWEIGDLLRLTDEHLAGVRAAAKPAGTDIVLHSGDGIGVAAYWVYASDQHHSAKVHKWDCINCNGGEGRRGGQALAGKWHDCATLDDALRLAESLQPDNHSVCKMCIGSYRKSGYRGPRGSRPRRALLH
jgi:transposase-like protein